MQMKQAFKMAIKSIKGNGFRSFLTMLGIIIGVASVIILVSIINGFSSQLTDTFSSLGTEQITVMISGRSADNQVKPDEMMEVRDNSEYLRYCSPLVNMNIVAKNADNNILTTLSGVSEDYDEIKDYSLLEGRMIQYGDVKNRSKVAVIGNYVAEELFGGKSPLGKIIKLGGESYEVIGVFSEKADSKAGSDDDVVWVPYSTASRMANNATISTYVLAAKDTESVNPGMDDIESFLLTRFENDDYYTMISVTQILEQLDILTSMLTMVLVGVASISLLVGGIGIMNIMLVSVSERTKEIGIRKSLGGRYRDILSQFVIEAGITSAFGGVIGIVAGIALSYLAGDLIGMSVKVSASSVMIAFSVSVGIGILFGYSPARKAARLSPIDALRYQ